MAELAQGFLVPSAELHAATSWEELLRTMAPRIKEAGPFSGVTVQLRVYRKCGGESTDLVRSAVYTVGDIAPMEYDVATVSPCQTVKSP